MIVHVDDSDFNDISLLLILTKVMDLSYSGSLKGSIDLLNHCTNSTTLCSPSHDKTWLLKTCCHIFQSRPHCGFHIALPCQYKSLEECHHQLQLAQHCPERLMLIHKDQDQLHQSGLMEDDDVCTLITCKRKLCITTQIVTSVHISKFG